MKKELLVDAVETTVDVATIGGLSMSGIGAVLGAVILSPIIVISTVVGGAVIGLLYSSVKDDFARLHQKE